ncbi:MAG TPA: carboxypeptidase regulatory-like domain-containing protein [Bacteroidota bacterium]|nr:carboxypeptidase regulatory-like domain-containing protein [Bacteroidota bacterium]
MARTLAIIFGMIAVAGFLCILYGQSTTLTLEGKVLDNEGKAMPGANVVLINPQTGQRRGAATNVNGTYRILGIPPGTYTIEVTFIGYRQIRNEDVRFLTGQRPVMDFSMTPEAVQVSGVEVVGTRGQQFELRRLDVSTAVERAQIVDLPLNSRSPLNLAALAPGMRTFAATAGRALPASGSLPELRFINMYVDGAEWKSFFNGNLVGIPQTGSPLPQDAIQEFRTILSPFDAEYTRGGSWIINAITRRGTNETHAEAFGYFRTQALNERGPFQTTIPDYNRQQAGFTVSGAIVKDKLFYMASYEDQNENQFIDVVPGRPSYNPGLWDKYKGTFQAPNQNQTGVVRITYQADNDNSVEYIWSSRYLASKTNFGATVAEPAGIYGQYHVNSHMVKWTDFISPKVFNDLSFQYLRWRHYEPDVTNGPAYVYPSITLGVGTFPDAVDEDHYTLYEKLTFNVDDYYGSHIVKAGALLGMVTLGPWFPSYLNPTFTFATDTSALPRTATIGVGAFHPLDPSASDARTSDEGSMFGIYIQDQWNPMPQLTINLGLRYDVELSTLDNKFRVPWADSTNLTSVLPADWINKGDRKNDWTNLAPRFSFNYDVFGTGKTIVRGGYGITFDRTATFFGYYEKRDASWRTYQIQNPGTLDPAILRARIAAGGVGATPSLNIMNDQMRTPKNTQVSIGFGQQFSDEWGLNIDYVHAYAQGLYCPFNANYYKPSIARRVLTTAYGDINEYGSRARAWQHGFLTNLTYVSSNFRFGLAYTLSWSFSENDAVSTAWAYPSLLAMQRSDTDERHRVVISGTYVLPLDFKIGGLLTVASPKAFDVIDGRDLNDDNATNDDFVNGQRNQFPNYNSIRNWYKMLDMRVSKVFTIANAKVEALFEAFNVGNWFNAAGFFGTMHDQKGNVLANFAQPNAAYAPRQMQIGVKVTY